MEKRGNRSKAAVSALLTKLILTGLIVILSATFMVGCSSNTSSQMVDYYKVEEVKAFHSELEGALDDSLKAINKEDDKALDKALDKLESLCDGLKSVTDVSPDLQPYHDKILEASSHIESYIKAVRNDNLSKAASELESASALLIEAQENLPESS